MSVHLAATGCRNMVKNKVVLNLIWNAAREPTPPCRSVMAVAAAKLKPSGNHYASQGAPLLWHNSLAGRCYILCQGPCWRGRRGHDNWLRNELGDLSFFTLGVRHLTKDDERAAFPAARDHQNRRCGSRNRGDDRRPPQVLQDDDPDVNLSRWVLSRGKTQILFSAASLGSLGASTRAHPCSRHHGSEAMNSYPVIYPGAHV